MAVRTAEVPRYLLSFHECLRLALMWLLIIMFSQEPFLYCLSDKQGITMDCQQGRQHQDLYSGCALPLEGERGQPFLCLSFCLRATRNASSLRFTISDVVQPDHTSSAPLQYSSVLASLSLFHLSSSPWILHWFARCLLGHDHFLDTTVGLGNFFREDHGICCLAHGWCVRMSPLDRTRAIVMSYWLS